MPLTPEDVRNKQFTTVRLREGYDEDEVDAFLDEVEAELTRLLRENDELRAKLAAATREAASQPGGARQQPPPPTPATPVPAPMPPRGGPPMGGPPMGGPMGPQGGGGPMGPGGGGGDSAARVLALAQQTADQAIAEARNEANKIIGDARVKAETVEREARNKADAMERDAQNKHQQAIGSLESQRVLLERKVDDLRAFEREYRTRLKSYLEGQLRSLEGQGEDSLAPAASRAPLPQPTVQQMRGSDMRPPAPQAQSLQAPAPMRGFLIDEDPDN
jgi:DivIVA domain-containing protein